MSYMMIVNSDTWYGRGSSPDGEEVRAKIRAAKAVLDLLVPGEPIYGYCDEDYGWIVRLAGDELDELLRQYPDSLVEDGTVYLHNGKSDCEDMFTVEVDGRLVDRMVTVYAIAPHHEKALNRTPVERTLSAMIADWYENYGSH